jgi:hypothetical protein
MMQESCPQCLLLVDPSPELLIFVNLISQYRLNSTCTWPLIISRKPKNHTAASIMKNGHLLKEAKDTI